MLSPSTFTVPAMQAVARRMFRASVAMEDPMAEGTEAVAVATSATNASNQAMRLTASKPDVHAWSVCRRERMLRGMHSGLAAADLVSR